MIIEPGVIISGRYEIVEKLGRGGFSVVWRARQRATGQHVAVKFLRAERAEHDEQREKARQRFEHEMRLMARISHPNIVKLMDSDQLEDGQYYTVMDLVEGEDLSRTLRRGRMDAGDASRLMMQVLDALGAAHQRQVIHRDLKPQNIMITTSGVRRNAIVVDFGIATLSEAARGPDYSTVTAANEFPGTVYYMAPETLRGAEITPAVDIYAWGLVFLECLTGEKAVSGKNAYEVIHKHTSPTALPLPEPLASHALGKVLQRALHKDPSQRYQTAAEVAADLERCAVEDLDLGRLTYTAVEFTPGEPLPPEPLAPRARSPGDPTPAQAGQAEAPEAAPTERSHLTYLAASLVFVGESADEGSGDEVALMQVIEQRWERIVDRMGGRAESKETGRMLATFGLPFTHDDDAIRAVNAALQMVDVPSQLDGELAAAAREFKVQVGLHTGRVVVTGGVPEANHLRRRPPAVARDLQHSAPLGGIAVSEDTLQLLRGRFYSQPGPLVHTVAGPHQTWALQAQGLDSTTDVQSYELLTPFVGRDAELAHLDATWRKVRTGQGAAVLIGGDAGLGKSRLVSELCRSISREGGTRILSLSCAREAQNSPLRPVIELLRRAFDHDEAPPPGERLALWLEDLGVEDPQALPLLADLAGFPLDGQEPLGLPPTEQKKRTIEILTAVFLAMAEQRPLVTRVEDLHWADPTTLEWLGSLLAGLRGSAMLLLLTHRPSFTSTFDPAWATSLELQPLSPEAVEVMIDHLTADRPLPQRVRQRIAHRSDRVPLYVEEVIRVLLAAQSLDLEAAELDTSPGAQAVLPSTVRTSIAARLASVGPSKVTALRASVLGRSFDVELLEAISDVDPPTLHEHLKALKHARLLQGSRRGGYRFHHSLVQETAYDSLVRADRLRHHLAAAEAMERIWPALAQERPALVAHHYAAAEAYAPAIHHTLLAARAAMARSANIEALSLLEGALPWVEALPEGPARDGMEFSLRSLLPTALMYVRGWSNEGVQLNHTRCRELAPRLTHRPDIFPSLWGIWVFNQSSGRYQAALEIARENLSFAETEGEVGHLLEANISLGTNLFYLGELEPAAERMQQASELYDPGQHHSHMFSYGQEPGVTARAQLAWNQWFLGRLDQALPAALSAVELAQELSNTTCEALARGCLTCLYMFMGDVDRAHAEAERAIALSQGSSSFYWAALGGVVLAWAKSLRGEGSSAELAEAIAGYRAIGVGMLGTTLHFLLGQALLGEGRAQACLEQVALGKAVAEGQEERFHEPELWRLEAAALGALGQAPEEAQASLEQAIRRATRIGSPSQELRAALDLAALTAGGPRASAALAAVRRALGRITEGEGSPEISAAYALLDG